MSTITKPNAELAYRVIDHIDANPEQWNQQAWVSDCGAAYCFAGWALTLTGHELKLVRRADGPSRMDLDDIMGVYADHVQSAAAAELGLAGFSGRNDAEMLFSPDNSRETLGELVTEIFGPRPAVTR